MPGLLLRTLEGIVPAMQQRAEQSDADEVFPAEDIGLLRDAGALLAPLPRALGGLGAGAEPEGAELLLQVLRLLGQGNPSVGRLYEAHVNAVALIARYGRPEQLDDVTAGQVFGLWVTDAPDAPLRAEAGRLRGAKSPCSGAGHATRALVTVQVAGEDRLAIVDPAGATVRPMRGLLHGMRGAVNGSVAFDGLLLPDEQLVGQPGDYLREPDFSCGAWRTTAVTLGLLEALVEETARQLTRRGHHRAVPQQERYGLAWIGTETARLWTRAAAMAAEGTDPKQTVRDRIAYVNMARIAVESACLDALRHVQRSLGLAAFLTRNPVERMARDLTTYLRQPAPDAVLTEAAAYLLGRS